MRALPVALVGRTRPELLQFMVHAFSVAMKVVPYGRGRLANGFAVPASALRVHGGKHLLVRFGGPFKGRRELDFVDFVVMIDEDVRLHNGVLIVGFRGKLMRMPVVE
jgi:hypothetical protein